MLSRGVLIASVINANVYKIRIGRIKWGSYELFSKNTMPPIRSIQPIQWFSFVSNRRPPSISLGKCPHPPRLIRTPSFF